MTSRAAQQRHAADAATRAADAGAARSQRARVDLKDTWMTLEEIKKVATPACREFKVKRLDLFGSLARGEHTAESDVDLLVEFEEPGLHPSKRFFGLLHHLEDALGCEVDLLTVSSLSNPYFRRRVLKERMNIYGG